MLVVIIILPLNLFSSYHNRLLDSDSWNISYREMETCILLSAFKRNSAGSFAEQIKITSVPVADLLNYKNSIFINEVNNG